MRIRDVVPLNEGVNDPHIFKALFLAGGAGSGKSYVAGKLTGQRAIRTGLKVVNSDDVYEYLMSVAGIDMTPDNIYSIRGQELRARAKEITNNREKIYIDGRLGLIIDGTGKDINKITVQKQKLEELGYNTMMLFINTTEEVAIARDKKRVRSVGASEVSRMWKSVQDNIMKFQQLFGAKDFHVVDNSGGLEDPDRLQNFQMVEKNIDKFLAIPPNKQAARKWISAAKEIENLE